jgi:hypothetical protein
MRQGTPSSAPSRAVTAGLVHTTGRRCGRPAHVWGADAAGQKEPRPARVLWRRGAHLPVTRHRRSPLRELGRTPRRGMALAMNQDQPLAPAALRLRRPHPGVPRPDRLPDRLAPWRRGRAGGPRRATHTLAWLRRRRDAPRCHPRPPWTIPGRPRTPVRASSHRAFVPMPASHGLRPGLHGSIFRLRTGGPGPQRPTPVGDHSTVPRPFQPWCQRGLLARLWAVLGETCDAWGGVDGPWQAAAAMGHARLGGDLGGRPPTDRGTKG